MTNNDLRALAIGAIVISGIAYGYINFLSDRDTTSNTFATCIHQKALSEGFHGSPEQEWHLFAESCAK